MASIDLGKISVIKNATSQVTKGSGGIVLGISQPSSIPLSYARFQRNYNWDVMLPDVSSLFGNSTSSNPVIQKVLTTAKNVLEGVQGLMIAQLCQSVSFGDYTIEETTMRYGAYQAFFPGLASIEKVTMTFLKPSPDVVSPYFNSWKRLMIDDDGLYQVASKYKKTIYVRFLDSSGISIQRYKLIGAFPISFAQFDLDYTQEKIAAYKVSFRVDKIELE